METQKEVLEKIKKLTRLSEGTSFPEEAANALAKAQSLMLKHKVTQNQLAESLSEEDDGIIADSTPLNTEDMYKQRVSKWKGTLAFTLASNNGCYVIWRGTALQLFGKAGDIEVVRYLYSYCQKEIERLSKIHCRGRGKGFSNGFKRGCVAAIGACLDQEKEKFKEELASNVRALVVIKQDSDKAKEFAENYFRAPIRATPKQKINIKNFDAILLGRNVGSTIYKGKNSKMLTS